MNVNEWRNKWNGSRLHLHLLVGSLIGQRVWICMCAGVVSRRRGVLPGFSFLGRKLHFSYRRVGSSQVWPVGWHGKIPRYFPVPICDGQGQAFVKIHKQKNASKRGLWEQMTKWDWMIGWMNEWLIVVVVMVKVIMLRCTSWDGSGSLHYRIGFASNLPCRFGEFLSLWVQIFLSLD